MSEKNPAAVKTIHISLIGHDIDKVKTEKLLVSQKGATRYRDAFQLITVSGEAWFLDYGVLVCWDLSTDDRKQLQHELTQLGDNNQASLISEQYSYTVDNTAEFGIKHDHITMAEDTPLVRLALSHAFAQSTKLQLFEDNAQAVISDNKTLSRELAATGKIHLNRIQLAKLRGLLFDTSSDITLNFNLLDTPEFFWDYPELENYYLTLARYLDLKPRIDILNHKLNTIHELLNMLASEQHHKHSAFLEWIIIILIAVDILIYFLPK